MKRSRLNPISKKRRTLNVKRRTFVADILKERPYCEARIRYVCSTASVDVHEILTRARGGSIIDPINALALCRPCHTFITENPAFSQEYGFTVHSFATSADLIAAERARIMYVRGEQ